jgi:hypothetical protein
MQKGRPWTAFLPATEATGGIDRMVTVSTWSVNLDAPKIARFVKLIP